MMIKQLFKNFKVFQKVGNNLDFNHLSLYHFVNLLWTVINRTWLFFFLGGGEILLLSPILTYNTLFVNRFTKKALKIMAGVLHFSLSKFLSKGGGRDFLITNTKKIETAKKLYRFWYTQFTNSERLL